VILEHTRTNICHWASTVKVSCRYLY